MKGFEFYSYSSEDFVKYCEITRKELKYPFKCFSGDTEQYWKDLEPKGKKYMILRMEEGNYIRNSNKKGEELKAEDINEKFVILDGIDYKSNDPDASLIGSVKII